MKKSVLSQAFISTVAAVAAFPLAAAADDTPPVATAREGHAGYDHPNQYLVRQTTKIADNMMPVMAHPAQDKEARDKLAEFEKRTGKRPNIVIFLMDDVGWMDVGFNGGGIGSCSRRRATKRRK